MPMDQRNKINKIKATEPEMTLTFDLIVNLLPPAVDTNGG